jgi:hypothetical protein
MPTEAPVSGTQRLINADFLTSSYRVVGKIMVPNTGLMGLMNDGTNSFMEVLDARLARLHMPTKLVDHFEVVRLVKSQVIAVCMAKREDIGPQALARGGYVRLAEYLVRVVTQVGLGCDRGEGLERSPPQVEFPLLQVQLVHGVRALRVARQAELPHDLQLERGTGRLPVE